jgi:uncharacterized integral membrane protein
MKNKELLLKIVISVTAFFCIVLLVFSFILQNQKEGTESYEFYNLFTIILVIICFALGIVMYFMMGKIKITPKKKSPYRININAENYSQFEEQLMNELKNKGYTNMIDIPNNLNCSMKYSYKITFNKLEIMMLLREEELTQNILENYYECFGRYILDNHKDCISKDFEMIHCICVDRITPSFKAYTEEFVSQPYGRYHLPVGISFGGRTVYIAPKDAGFFEVRYHELLKKFKLFIKSQIISEQ